MKISEIAPGQKRNLLTVNFNSIWDRLIVPNCSEIIEMYKKSDSFFL